MASSPAMASSTALASATLAQAFGAALPPPPPPLHSLRASGFAPFPSPRIVADAAWIAPVSMPAAARHSSHPRAVKQLFFSSSTSNDAGNKSSSGASTSSRRGKTRQSLGLEDVKLSNSCDSVSNSRSSPLSSTSIAVNSNVMKNSEFDGDATFNVKRDKNQGFETEERDLEDTGAMSFDEWIKKNATTSGPSKAPVSRTSKEFAKKVQDFINADLEIKHTSEKDDDDDDFPLYMDEDDPNWLDEPDEGWGFRISDLFTEKFDIKKVKNDKDDEYDDIKDVPDIEWDLEPETWSAKDIDSMNWRETVFEDPSPLVVVLYERYGSKGRECYHVLRELEDAANQIWKCNRLPPRLSRINVSLEVDLTNALGIKEVPTFLFIKAGKLQHQQSGYFTADNLMKMIAYFYHGGGRPACLKKVQAPENISDMS